MQVWHIVAIYATEFYTIPVPLPFMGCLVSSNMQSNIFKKVYIDNGWIIPSCVASIHDLLKKKYC